MSLTKKMIILQERTMVLQLLQVILCKSFVILHTRKWIENLISMTDCFQNNESVSEDGCFIIDLYSRSMLCFSCVSLGVSSFSFYVSQFCMSSCIPRSSSTWSSLRVCVLLSICFVFSLYSRLTSHSRKMNSESRECQEKRSLIILHSTRPSQLVLMFLSVLEAATCVCLCHCLCLSI